MLYVNINLFHLKIKSNYLKFRKCWLWEFPQTIACYTDLGMNIFKCFVRKVSKMSTYMYVNIVCFCLQCSQQTWIQDMGLWISRLQKLGLKVEPPAGKVLYFSINPLANHHICMCFDINYLSLAECAECYLKILQDKRIFNFNF